MKELLVNKFTQHAQRIVTIESKPNPKSLDAIVETAVTAEEEVASVLRRFEKHEEVPLEEQQHIFSAQKDVDTKQAERDITVVFLGGKARVSIPPKIHKKIPRLR